MSDTAILAIVAAIPSALAALGTVVIAIRQGVTNTTLTEVKHHTNSLAEAAVTNARSVGHSEGVAAGVVAGVAAVEAAAAERSRQEKAT